MPTLEEYESIPEIEGFKKIPLGRSENIIYQKNNRLTALYRTSSIKWLFKCDCGTYKEIKKADWKNGQVQSCGCIRKADITNQRFGHLVALEPTNKRSSNNVIWKCQCDCGNIVEVIISNLKNGSTQSCGCSRKEDISGQKFGHLTALEPTDKRSGNNVIWKCQCDCGNIIEVAARSLKTNNTISCGCIMRKDITNQRFGHLIALEPTDKRSWGSVIWKCQCDCGSIVEIRANSLISGDTISCGCIKSKGQAKISKLLNTNNLIYQTEKKFDNLKFSDNNSSKARFDFYINNQYLIEYDGIQHYEYSDSGWNTEEHFIKVQEHDKIKNQYCIDNHIPLIRIPYTKLDTLCIEDLLLETTTFRVEGT